MHQSFLPDGVLGASDARPFTFDPVHAKTLLAEAGLPDGFAVSVDVAANSPALDIAEALQANFARAGVRLTLVPSDRKETLTRYRARQHELYLGDWGTDYPDPASNAQAFTSDNDESDAAPLKTLAWRNSWQNIAKARRLDSSRSTLITIGARSKP